MVFSIVIAAQGVYIIVWGFRKQKLLLKDEEAAQMMGQA